MAVITLGDLLQWQRDLTFRPAIGEREDAGLERSISWAVTVRTTQRVDMMAVLANAGASVTSTDRDTIEVRGLPVDRIAQLVAAHGLALHALHTAPRSLEEIYLQRTNRERNPR